MNKPHTEHLYQADQHMLYVIMKTVLTMKRNCYLCDLVLLIYTSYVYNQFNENLKFFALLAAAMIFFLGVVQYLLIVKKGNFINHLVIDVNTTADHVQIQTATFSGPWWFKKNSIMITMIKTDIRMQEVDNPYPNTFKGMPKLTRLVHKGKDEFFVITPYFDAELAEDLQN